MKKFMNYLVSEDGDVFNASTGKKLSTFAGKKNKYRIVDLNNNGTRHRFLVHRLVAILYIGYPYDKKLQVNHIDGNVLNNNYKNLEWVTCKENLKHMVKLGGTMVRNFIEVELYKDDIFIKKFKSIKEAARFAKEIGGKSESLIKYNKDSKGFSVKKV